MWAVARCSDCEASCRLAARSSPSRAVVGVAGAWAARFSSALLSSASKLPAGPPPRATPPARGSPGDGRTLSNGATTVGLLRFGLLRLYPGFAVSTVPGKHRADHPTNRVDGSPLENILGRWG